MGRPSTSASSVTTDKETMAILSKVDNDVKERIIEKMDSERLASSVRLTAANASESTFCLAAAISSYLNLLEALLWTTPLI